MITQQELTDKCTPEIIKKMCELAEGFEFKDWRIVYISGIGWNIRTVISNNSPIFPLLIHRAVEGWNKKYVDTDKENGNVTLRCMNYLAILNDEHKRSWLFSGYQPTTLTHAECAMLDCLLEMLK